MSVLMKNGNNYTGSTSGGGGATNLNGLSDVEVSSPSNGQVLSYDSSTAKWENGSVPIASANTVGGIKVGQNLSIQSDGTLNATGGGGGVTYDNTQVIAVGTYNRGGTSNTVWQKTFVGTTSSSADDTVIGTIGRTCYILNVSGAVKWSTYGQSAVPWCFGANDYGGIYKDEDSSGTIHLTCHNASNDYRGKQYEITVQYW